MRTQRSLTARSYLLLLLLGGIIAFSLVGLGMLQSMRNVRLAAESERAELAQQELVEALRSVEAEAQEVAARLASWDEVYQQLVRPAFYAYWRDQRVHDVERFPLHVRDLELYAANGAVLTKTRGSSMPQMLDSELSFVSVFNGTAYLYQFAPVESRSAPGDTIGHVGIKIALMDALTDSNRFVNLDVSTLRLIEEPSAAVDVARAASLFGYQTATTSLDTQLSMVMSDTLVRLAVLFGLLVLAFAWMVTRLFTRPLRALDSHLDALRQGRRSALGSGASGVFPVLELERVRHSLNSYQQELDNIYQKLDAKNEELWSMAHIDALTGAHNRRAYELDLRKIQDVADNQRLEIAFMLFDCDFFKAINDTYGHAVGDQVIQGIAHSLHSALRKGDRLYRLGGDEFAAILLGADMAEADRVARRCQEAVRVYPFQRAGVREPVRISVGIAVARGTDESSLNGLQRHADLAMYRAKRTSGDRVVHYTPELGLDMASALSSRVVHAVMAALETGQNLHMDYQPVVRLADGTVSHYEALMRIQDESGSIGPAEILALARRRSLEVELDSAVLRRVEVDLSQGLVPPHTGVAINISGVSIAATDLCQRIQPLRAAGRGKKLILEITETDLITQFQLVSENLSRLRKDGFNIALDDFGSGYSSIRYLANMPVDTVKFDISMIRDLQGDERARGIVEHTARLVLDAGYELVAEGIESQHALDVVRGIGFTHGQGYLLGRPAARVGERTTSSVGRVLQ